MSMSGSNELIVLINQVCVILHYMIVDMWERGELRYKVSEGGDAVDDVGEFTGDVAGVFGSEERRNGNGSDYAEPHATAPPFAELLVSNTVVMSEE